MLKTAINLADYGCFVTADLNAGHKSSLSPAEERSQHLTGLVAIIVDCLLANENETWIFTGNDFLQQFCHSQRLNIMRCLDVDASVGSHCQPCADRFLIL